MKVCAREGITVINGYEFAQLKVWVDELRNPTTHERIQFPCNQAYVQNSYLVACRDAALKYLIQNIYATFMSEFMTTVEFEGNIEFSYPFDYEPFEKAVLEAVKPGSIGMSCLKDVDNPEHWVEIKN